MNDEAIHWLLKQRDGAMDAAEWEAFTLWLEADPRHAAQFDALIAADEELDALGDKAIDEELTEAAAPVLNAANDNPVSRWLPWAMASAAALVAALFFLPNIGGAPSVTSLATGPGEIRTVALSEDIVMTLNGSTQVLITEGEPTVEIALGEVAFAIDAAEPSPLRVEVDGLVLTDFGTVFSVTLDEANLSVAVSEGVVLVNPDEDALEVEAGEAIDKSVGLEAITFRDIDVGTVATWREGRLEFDDTAIAEAISQIERSTGLRITLAPRYSQARLTGSLVIPQSAAQEAEFVATLAGLVGGTASRSDGAWSIQ